MRVESDGKRERISRALLGELGNKGDPLLFEILDSGNALLRVLDHLAEKEGEGSFGNFGSLSPV